MHFSPYVRISGGLLGGSFNPPHAGHVAISLLARKRLKLDRVVWLVSPQNPLKSKQGMAPFPIRMAACQRLTKHLPISVSDIEQQWQSPITFYTLQRLRRRFPRIRWVFMTGSENFGQLHRWHHWNRLLKQAALAVFSRPCYNSNIKLSRAGHRYHRNRLSSPSAIRHRHQLPAWVFVPESWYRISSTKIRQELGNKPWYEA